MHILFLDTASAEPSLVLLVEGGVMMRKVLPKQGESHVTILLEEAMKECGWRYEDITHIACVIGPGGFVSLRVGITVANVLSHLLGIPVAGVHLSELWWARCQKPEAGSQKSDLLWLHSTRKVQLFIRGFGEFAKRFPEPTLVDIEEIATLKAKYVGELLEEHKKLLPGCTPFPPSQLQPIEEMLPAFLTGLPYEKRQLLPWYGREA